MRWRTVAGVALLALGLIGCDKIPFIGKKPAKAPPGTPAATTPPPKPDTAKVAAAPRPAPKPKPAPAAAVDEPWTPVDTGTVTPGMSRDQVIALWGPPVAERQRENWTYLYFRNGCEASCGTFDVVFLEKGQVVDAIVRGPGHNYGGVSSSPPGRKPEVTPPASGAPLRVGP